ncbi:hypothetical protein A3742_08010 [Oleiphilus sp. HI0071]|nr:hypothetical protein A3737_10885 [Oleiphilus sp. HI0065]KZY82819.1 hypothetical protein A3742_08010 [Oleiphilus sp. HI0071]KZZ04869.1 hypothetical protein A3744_09360 [Oleiphilus sp. HI0073]KZZ47663.1 hypothetical protein A3758_34200 [Oleiphilus sp. HI0118]KZZ56665.1 hypothetical protein A3760_08470 [Oleiphilus sp. HI0122]
MLRHLEREWVLQVFGLMVLFLSILLCAGQGHADEGNKELRLGISLSIPPWVIRETDSGLKLDIIRKALEGSGYNVKTVYAPYARAYELFERGKVDAIMSPGAPIVDIGFLSEPVVNFHNVAISLKKKGFPGNLPWSFLHDKSIVAFQKASLLLGNDFSSLVKDNPLYEEIGRQHLQLNLLFVREVDLIVMERSIFGYFWRQAVEREYPGDPRFLQQVQFHELFDVSEYRYLFLSEEDRDVFDKGLDRIKKDGTYNALLEQYGNMFERYDPIAKVTSKTRN